MAKGEKPEILAHELGHLISRESKKGMKVDRLADNRFNREYNKPLFTAGNEEESTLRGTLRKSINNYIEQRRAIKNEELANKNGLRLLKQDLTPEEMKLAKENLGKALDTYRYKGKMYYKEPLWRKIQIPSLRDPNKILPPKIAKKLDRQPKEGS